MDNGASGYVLKNASGEEILEAVGAVTKGKTYLSFEAGQTMKARTENRFVLTRREKEVLELIAEGMTNGEIATKLFVSVTTVDTHRKNLLAKFNARNVAELIKLAFYHKIISVES
jgi:DNA-binding NarL/FixJ family response regulator